ncbi:MAG: hypothetical protein NTV24_03330 [Candidatus Woesebacteria bacterium]|nr:hypothetical protein [Candidatus Woesebacteria bacterium]
MEEVRAKQKKLWRSFFENWKKVWRNPNISVYEKATLYNAFLYRSDGEGWSISERKMAKDLGISKGKASKSIDGLREKGLLLGERKERKRGKLRLPGLLRNPVWVTTKPNTWVTGSPNKYQTEEQRNNTSFKERTGKLEKAMTPEQLHAKIQQLREGSNK